MLTFSIDSTRKLIINTPNSSTRNHLRWIINNPIYEVKIWCWMNERYARIRYNPLSSITLWPRVIRSLWSKMWTKCMDSRKSTGTYANIKAVFMLVGPMHPQHWLVGQACTWNARPTQLGWIIRWLSSTAITATKWGPQRGPHPQG